MRPQALGKVVSTDAVFAFGCGAARPRDEPADRRISLPVFGEHHHLEPVVGNCSRARVANELAANDQLERKLLGRRMRTHHAGHGALVGQREPRVAERGGSRYEFLRMRRAA